MVIDDEHVDDDDESESEAREQERKGRISFLHVMAWIGAVMIVLMFGLGVLVFRVSDEVDNLGDEVHNIDEATARTEGAATQASQAATKASEDLSAAIERSSNNSNSDQVREAFIAIHEIRTLLCLDHPDHEICQAAP